MRVLVTGGAGFIGGHLVADLLAQGHDVTVVDDLSVGSRAALERATGGRTVPLHAMDTRDARFPPLVEQVQPARVYHLASHAEVAPGARDTRVDVARTLEPVLAVLEATRRVPGGHVVLASSNTVYGEPSICVDEHHGALEPLSLYGAAKLAAEAQVHAYAHLFGLRATVLRFPNVVGAGMTHGAVRDFMATLRGDTRELRLRGNGTQRKGYLHVTDLLDGIRRAVASTHRTVNLVPADDVDMASVARAVMEEMGRADVALSFEAADRGWPGDVRALRWRSVHAEALGFRPSMESLAAVRRAVRDELRGSAR